MATYQVDGTVRSRPGTGDWETILVTDGLNTRPHWVRHWYRPGVEEERVPVSRADALQTAVEGLRLGATVYQPGEGGVKVGAFDGEASCWLQPAPGRLLQLHGPEVGENGELRPLPVPAPGACLRVRRRGPPACPRRGRAAAPAAR